MMKPCKVRMDDCSINASCLYSAIYPCILCMPSCSLLVTKNAVSVA